MKALEMALLISTVIFFLLFIYVHKIKMCALFLYVHTYNRRVHAVLIDQKITSSVGSGCGGSPKGARDCS